jgi:prepilin-type N-terminal cleavage/methylation domain-containing protein
MTKERAEHRLPGSPAGFSLLELAIGMAVVGMILSGALLISGRFMEFDRREETRQQLRETKAALLVFAKKQGRLPMMDTSASATLDGDGSENKIPDNPDPSDPFNVLFDTPAYNYPGNIFGWVPYDNIGTSKIDPYRKQVQYFVNWQLAKEGGDKPCLALKYLLEYPQHSHYFRRYTANPDLESYRHQKNWAKATNFNNYNTPWYPLVVVKSLRFPVAAVLVSSAQNRIFDSPNDSAFRVAGFFEAKEQLEGFDDIVEYISLSEAYAALNCK